MNGYLEIQKSQSWLGCNITIRLRNSSGALKTRTFFPNSTVMNYHQFIAAANQYFYDEQQSDAFQYYPFIQDLFGKITIMCKNAFNSKILFTDSNDILSLIFVKSDAIYLLHLSRDKFLTSKAIVSYSQYEETLSIWSSFILPYDSTVEYKDAVLFEGFMSEKKELKIENKHDTHMNEYEIRNSKYLAKNGWKFPYHLHFSNQNNFDIWKDNARNSILEFVGCDIDKKCYLHYGESKGIKTIYSFYGISEVYLALIFKDQFRG